MHNLPVMRRSAVQKRHVLDTPPCTNQAAQPVFDHALSSAEHLELYHPRVRDRTDVPVLRCRKTGLILLGRSDHMDLGHYCEQSGFSYWGVDSRDRALERTRRDDRRRVHQFRHLLEGKRCLDIGSGPGGFLDLAKPVADTLSAVEPQSEVRKVLSQCGYKVYPSIEQVSETGFDVVTLFHVFEHMSQPIEALAQARRRLRPKGLVVVEVPHAKDYLLSHLDHEPFKSFTFWSEHLILHTRETLRLYLELAGFSNIDISGYQRYPLANHLHWLRYGRPGGHELRPDLSTPALDDAYATTLDSLDATDTLIAIGEA
jgi:2-polyprenyl-3-methyl-5-hydroxy-6-metoxy-1,4-benzoquinol methylase